jgi:hypothetical protein
MLNIRSNFNMLDYRKEFIRTRAAQFTYNFTGNVVRTD